VTEVKISHGAATVHRLKSNSTVTEY